MSYSDRLVGIRLKIKRANYHIQDFEQRLIAFRKGNPYRLITEPDPQTGECVFKVRVYANPPTELALIIGEAIHQLRSCLDHMAWQLVEANGNTPNKGTYFPIYETAAKYKSEASTKIKKMSVGAKSIIDTLKPYQGGTDALWKLHELNNFEKHRLLFIVASRVEDASLIITNGMPSPQSASIQLGAPVPVLSSGEIRLLKDGTEIGRIGGQLGPNVQTNLKVSFEIVFDEPGIVRGEPVLPFLQQLSNFVDRIVDQFIPFL